MTKVQLTILFLIVPLFLFPQYDQYKKLNYAPPVDEPLLLAGNFAELRNNHFHGGLDLKTKGQEGLNIYSIEDGYVSRIKIDERSYGKCLFIHHPKTGHTSVYAHLQKFSPEIEAFVKKNQYLTKSYTIDVFPKIDELPILKRQLVAYSGNTGGSTAPHLHFEIRDLDEQTLNPLLFGFNIKDEIKPNINLVGIYPIGNGLVNNKDKPVFLPPFKGPDGIYKLSDAKPIEVSGTVGFGLSTIDYLNNSSNVCGIFSIALYVDGHKYFEHTLEKVSLAETRYINSLVDYPTWKKTGSKIQKCFVDPGNRLSTYSSLVQNGYVQFNDQSVHQIKIVIKDSYLNTSEVQFTVKNTPSLNTSIKNTEAKKFKHDQVNTFEWGPLSLSIPYGALYEDLAFNFSVDTPKKGGNIKSSIYKIHNKYTPLHKKMTLSIQAPEISVTEASKAFIAQVDGGTKYNPTTYNNGVFQAEVKNFGNFTILKDISPPSIVVRNLKNGAVATNIKEITVKISDDLSGIGTYHGFIDDQWILFEYEYKNSLLTYKVDEYFPKLKGKHTLKIQVTDKVGNIKEITQTFTI